MRWTEEEGVASGVGVGVAVAVASADMAKKGQRRLHGIKLTLCAKRFYAFPRCASGVPCDG